MARSPPAPPSCARTGPPGPQTRRKPAGLLASEIIATTGQTPSQHYAALTEQYGTSHYARIDAPADREQKAVRRVGCRTGHRTELAGDPITAVLTSARQRCGDRWAEGADRERMVCMARPSGTGRRLQDLRGELGERRAPEQVQRAARELVTTLCVSGDRVTATPGHRLTVPWYACLASLRCFGFD